MPGGGFIKLHRSLHDHFVWRDYGKEWIDLLLLAAWKDTEVTARGVVVPIGRGQLLASNRFLATRWRWSIGKVQRFLALLEDADMIVVEAEHEWSRAGQIVTISNYDDYQGDTQTDTQTGTQTGTQANEKQVRTNPHGPKAYEETRDTNGTQTDTQTSTHAGTHAGTNKKKVRNQEPKKEETNTSSGAPGGVTKMPLPELVPDESEGDVPRLSPKAIVAAWIDQLPTKPSKASVAQQAGVAKRLSEAYPAADVKRALDGIGRVFPFDTGQPWSVMDLEKRFMAAVTASLRGGQGGRREQGRAAADDWRYRTPGDGRSASEDPLFQ